MTNKKGCVGSYPVSGYTRSNGVEVSGYTRRCGAPHASQEDKMQRRVDILYPSMNKVLKGGVEYDYYPEGNEYPAEESSEEGAPKKEKDYDEIANVFYPTMKDKGVEFSSGLDPQKDEDKKFALHQPQNIVAVDYIHNKTVRDLGENLKGKEAAENLYMSKSDSYLNTPYSKEHMVHNNYLNVDSGLQQYLKDKITQQIGEDKLLTTKGIEIAPDTESAKRLSKVLQKHERFIQELINNKDKLKKGISFDTSIKFIDKNFNNALGNVDILNIHINQKGDLELIVCDTYEFNKGEKSDLVRLGRERQLQGKIIPYFLIYHVIIPRDEIKVK